MVRFASVFVLAAVLVSSFAAPARTEHKAILHVIEDVYASVHLLKTALVEFPGKNGVAVDKTVHDVMQRLSEDLGKAAALAKSSGPLSDKEAEPIIRTIVSFQKTAFSAFKLTDEKKKDFKALPVDHIIHGVEESMKVFYEKLKAWEMAFRHIAPPHDHAYLVAIDERLNKQVEHVIDVYSKA